MVLELLQADAATGQASAAGLLLNCFLYHNAALLLHPLYILLH
jgi:hypothetical protein